MSDLRLASRDDKSSILDLLVMFYKESPYHGTLLPDVEKIEQSIETALAADKTSQVMILATEQEKPIGLLVGIIQEFPFSTARHATESIWFVDPAHRSSRAGIQLFEAFEYWARKLGVSVIHTGAPSGRMDKFYQRRGYEQVEKVYMKWL